MLILGSSLGRRFTKYKWSPSPNCEKPSCSSNDLSIIVKEEMQQKATSTPLSETKDKLNKTKTYSVACRCLSSSIEDTNKLTAACEHKSAKKVEYYARKVELLER
ncbi:hypothetical protein ILUMI_09086 [Ignelater luminosus]|uniref:Uncharacterized protein n=1 Tax=Ignelater luminosus TaxID=2038154 RepID=A0A8K0D4J7_IGNLU|nr:hypothetical protein ILUMI_09086 [Ignelater luminosus]